MSKVLKNLRDDINNVVKELHLSDEDFHLVSSTRYRQIFISILGKFTTLEKTSINVWWWDFFLQPKYSYLPDSVFEDLILLINEEETVWFVIEDDAKKQDRFWLYESKIPTIIFVLNNLPFSEYYIVSKKFEWILCENHHNLLIGSGESIVKKMKLLSSK